MKIRALKKLSDYISKKKSSAIISSEVILGELVFAVHPKELHKFISFLKEDETCACQQLLDICGADYPEREERFDVVYNFLSLKHNHRIRVKTMLKDAESVQTVTDLYSMANWFEREVWDLFGIPFEGHPDLRRILTDYGFEHHPLRKDFPLTGFTELRYDIDQEKIVEEPVKLPQDYRQFDFTSPWEGMTSLQEEGAEKDRKPKVMGTKS